MKAFWKGFGIAILVGVVGGSALFVWPYVRIRRDNKQSLGASRTTMAPLIPQKTKEELIKDAMERSSTIRGLYMTADVANDPGRGATRLRERIIHLADTTEINGIVIDVKEVCGPDYNEARLKNLVDELHQKNIWAIARIVSFKDASQRLAHPEWYLGRHAHKATGEGCITKRGLTTPSTALQESGKILWQDNKGGYWMDPAADGARGYIARIGRDMIDLGFDELQFDYVRFPSDGDVSQAVYPVWDKKTPKHEVLKKFFAGLHDELVAYKPDIILSADLFGYVATQGEDIGIGQRVEDIGSSFNYLSFMVYPSHYYNGLQLPADSVRNLPAVSLNVAGARAHPDVIVGRSLLAAEDFLDGRATTSDSTITAAPLEENSVRARIRPWLEDFFHEQDRLAGRPWGAEKVRMQIDAAEQASGHGWMLWNASNVYSDAALHKE